MNSQRGSIWRKWDLHVHTPASALAHSLGNSWEIYVERLIEAANLHKVVAIATADYFTIDGYKNLLNYYDETKHTLSINGKSAQLYLVPGVELRLNIFNSEEESINLHILFDPEFCSSDFITQNFLEQLSIDYRGSTGLPLKQQNLLAIGKSITDGTATNLGQNFSKLDESAKSDYIKKAIQAITLSCSNIDDALKTVDEIFEKQNLPSKAYLIAVVGKGHGGINTLKWFEENKKFSRAGLIREHLTHQADVIFSNDHNDRNFYLGKRDDTPATEIESRFSNLKPCIWGSDAHTPDKLLHPSNGNTFDYTWIKADASFEGLKQITYEPSLRVRIQQDDPSEEETYAKIEKLEVDFPNDLQIKDKTSYEELPFCIQGKQEIHFSSNLNCIIGGRGSGKSTIIHILYNLSANRDTERLLKIDSPLFNLQFGVKDELAKIRSLAKSDIPSTTEFFLQNEVEKFAKDVTEMSGLIRNRLYGLSATDDNKKGLKQLEDEWLESLTDTDELIEAYDELVGIDKKIESINKQKATLKKQTDVIKSGEYKKLQNGIEEVVNHIIAFSAYEIEYKKITLEITELIKNIKRLDWSKYEGQLILESLSVELESKKEEINKSFEKQKKKYTDADYETKLKDKKTQLRNFLKDKGLSAENIGEVTMATQQIADLEEQVKVLKRDQIPYKDIYDKKDAVLKRYKEDYSSYKDGFKEVIVKLQTNLDTLKFDDGETNISFELGTNNQLLKDAIADFVKDSNTSKITLRSDFIQNVIFNDDDEQLAKMVSDKAKIVDAVNNSKGADAHTEILQDLISDPVFVEQLHLRIQRLHFDINNIQVQTKLGERSLQNTSFGERCGIVIAIVLVAGTNPIIIDQLEDNLDGKYISKMLVPLIRDQKQKRQIILVTRDANIAIGGDSELILILDKKGTGTVLLPATIENKTTRPKYIWILDGGEVAFQKREEKYCIQKKS
jgi:ABC-type cobalamin/Fe3+-siderophores transport system ATPase subunit